MKRVLLAGLFHETHSFLSDRTTMADFEKYILVEGEALIRRSTGDGSPTDGVLEFAKQASWKIIPSIHMAAAPSGLVCDDVVERFNRRFFADLEANLGQLDGICLVLHGAMVSESVDDVEGEILKRVREALRARGRGDLPVVAVLDLHANVSQAMVDSATVLTSYRENPHSDARESAVRAARMLDARMQDPRPVHQLHRPTPYVLPPTGVGSASAPMRPILDRARAIEAADPDIVGINVMAGYAYADISDCGFSLNLATTGSVAQGEAYLDELQELLETNLASGYPAEDRLDAVLAKADALPPGTGPVLLIEAADNIGGGSPGDATDILGPLLQTGRKGIVAAINDPKAVSVCAAAGLGTTLKLNVGAKTDDQHGQPVTIEGVVRHLSDGKFELENPKSHLASMQGTHIDMGPSAVVETGQATILLTSRKTAPMDLGHLHSQGVRPEDAALVIVKAAVSHRAAYDPIARASFNVDSAGLCTSNLTRLPYRKLKGRRIALDGPLVG
ncbi:MAG: M81 family metallopeptidase [Rhodobacteraceae bacterium]|nr:M81 family metallopeptidase [Paracoccaceae bacterium]